MRRRVEGEGWGDGDEPKMGPWKKTNKKEHGPITSLTSSRKSHLHFMLFMQLFFCLSFYTEYIRNH